jgi:hypothetical protein
MICDKEEPVIPDALPEHALPFRAVQSFHIALEGAGLHLRECARHAFLNSSGEFAKVPLCVFS